jgi:ABC-type Zn uptake system ZnuABC Zn-binding protein ZnuA
MNTVSDLRSAIIEKQTVRNALEYTLRLTDDPDEKESLKENLREVQEELKQLEQQWKGQ